MGRENASFYKRISVDGTSLKEFLKLVFYCVR